MVSNMQHTMGNMQGDNEQMDNMRVVQALVDELKARNMELVGDWRDGISKESSYIRKNQVRYVASMDDDCEDTDSMPHLTGLDCSHQGKSQRNAVGFGGTVAPHGGWLSTNISLFAAVGVKEEMIRVTEKFGDFRVESLFNSLKDFPILVESNYLITEVLGTQLYFTMVALAMLAQRSRNKYFTKDDRLRVAYFALMVLTSYKMHTFTLKNLVSWIVSLTFGLAKEGVTKPWRCSTLMLEYYFGLLRTHSNTDQLTVAQMGHVTEKVT